MESFFVIQSEHNDLFWSIAEEYGTIPRWTDEQYMKPFNSARDAEAVIARMHPDYRERLKPHAMEAEWVYCSKRKCEILATRMV